MTSRAWSTGMLVNSAETSKETISSFSCIFKVFSLSKCDLCMSTYNLAKYLTTILKIYTGHTLCAFYL